MSDHREEKAERISEEVLAERQYRLKNRILRELRAVYRKLETEEGLTQKAISRRIGKDASLVSRQLRGEVNMTLASLSDLLEGMNAELQLRAVLVKDLIGKADTRISSAINVDLQEGPVQRESKRRAKAAG